MGLTKQAKTLSKSQIALLLAMIQQTRYPVRNKTIFLLSLKAGLRAKEIASLKWEMLTDAQGQISEAIRLVNDASKGRSGRIIPINRELKSALSELQSEQRLSSFVIGTERSDRTSSSAVVNLFAGWYRAAGLQGCSSHSGRRTFITNTARRISTVGGSLRDVQVLAGHRDLGTTQRYIEGDADAQRRVVDLI